jgi:uncharacterized membrane protein YdjX (TVP38/TMEM64 family)
MQDQIAHLLDTYHELAIIWSILINIFISIIGFIPSVFLTALNIKLFGFFGGFIISLVGETLGALVSFWLYRLGFQYFVQNKTSHYPKVQRLLLVQGKEAFYLILSLRLVPFIPSSLVTLFAALGKVSWISFTLASTIGKIPALFMEIYSVNEVLNGSFIGKIILILLSFGIFIYVWQIKKAK